MIFEVKVLRNDKNTQNLEVILEKFLGIAEKGKYLTKLSNREISNSTNDLELLNDIEFHDIIANIKYNEIVNILFLFYFYLLKIH